MNNDFKPRPTPTPSQSNTADTTPNTGTDFATEADQPDQSDQPQRTSEPVHVITSRNYPGKIRKFFSFLGLLILLALVGGGVWYWQQMQIKDLTSAKSGLESQVSTLQSKLAADKATEDNTKATETPATSKPGSVQEIVTGKFVKQEGTNSVVQALYLPGKVTEIWVEIGTKPGEMSGSTKHLTEGLGAGTAGQYAKQEFGLIDLKAGTTYFYWTGAKVDGKTVYGGVSSFDTAK